MEDHALKLSGTGSRSSRPRASWTAAAGAAPADFDLEMITATSCTSMNYWRSFLRAACRASCAPTCSIFCRKTPLSSSTKAANRAAGRRDGARRPSPRVDARRIRLPAPLRASTTAPTLQRMGRDAAATVAVWATPGPWDWSRRRRLRRVIRHRPDRPAGRDRPVEDRQRSRRRGATARKGSAHPRHHAYQDA